MALVTLTGFPCSGKSRRAQELKTALEGKLRSSSYEGPQYNIEIVSDEALSIDRSVYNESRTEKTARASAFTAMQRQIGKNTILILDGLNYIKEDYERIIDFRILCKIFVVAKPDQCREWNVQRKDGRAYRQETLDNLFMRYEEPSSMVRWDSPLFTVPWDETIPFNDIWQAITSGDVKPPNTGTTAVRTAPTDALRTLEHTATTMTSILMSQQAQNGGAGGATLVPISSTCSATVNLPNRTVTLAELQRLKRSFVNMHKKAITLGTTERGDVDWSEQGVASKFATFLDENMR